MSQSNAIKFQQASRYLSEKHKGMKVSLKAILSGPVLMSNRKGEVVQVDKPLQVIATDRKNVILSDSCGHTLKLPINSHRIISLN